MPKVQLEFEVTSKGDEVILRLDKSLQSIVQTTTKASAASVTLFDAYGKPMESAAASTKKLADSTEQLGKTAAAGAGGMFRLGEAGQAAQQAFQGLAQEGAGLMGRFGGLLTALGPVGLGLGAAAYAAHSAITEFSNFATQVRDLSYISGGSARDVSVLVAGLEAFGVSSETVELGVAKMSAAIEAGSPALNRLGVSTRTTSGSLKDGLTMFYETVDALGSMTNEVERNALAREIFGRGWTSIMPILRMGSQAIREMGEESGKAVTAADIERMRVYKLSVHEFGETLDKLLITVGSGIIVPITMVLRALTPGGGRTQGSLQGLTQEQIFAATGIVPDLQVPFSKEINLSYSDVGTRFGLTRGAENAIAASETIDELEKRLKLKQQIASLDIVALTASAWSEEDRLAAAIAKVNAERQKTLDLIEMEYKKGNLGTVGAGKTLTDKAALEAGVIRVANAEKERLQIESALKIGSERIKIFDAEEARALKAAQTEIGLLQSIADASLLGDAAKLAAVDKWQQDNLLAIATVYGEEQQGQALITAVYTEAARRRAQIRIDTALEAEQRVYKGILATQGQISDASELAESHLVDATEWSTEERRKWRAQDYLNAKKNYDDEVTEAINAELQKLDIYKDHGRKQLDIVVGVYDGIEARRQKDIDNQKKALLIQMGATEDYFDKVGLALQYHVTDWRTADQRILEITRDFAQAGIRSLDDLYFNAAMGRFDKLGDVASAFGEQLLRIATQQAAISTMSWLFGGSGGTSGTSGGGTQAGSSADVVNAELAALAKAGGGGLVSGAGGSSGGGGLLGGVTNAISAMQKLYGLVTGAAEGGVTGAIDGLLGITNLVNTLTGGTSAVGSFGGLLGAAVGPGTTALMETSMAASAAASAAGGAAASSGASAAVAAEMGAMGAATTGSAVGSGAAAAGFGAASALSTYLPALAPIGIALYGFSQVEGTSEDELAQRMANTYAAELAKSPSDWDYNKGQHLNELQSLVRNGAQSTREALVIADLDAMLPGWRGMYDWNFTPYPKMVTYQTENPNSLIPTTNWATPEAYAALLGPNYAPPVTGYDLFGSGGLSEGRASGGPIEAGITYIGHGPSPEPFISARPGFVLTHQEARDIYRDAVSGQGGGGDTIHLHVNLSNSIVGEDIPEQIMVALERTQNRRARLRQRG